MGRLTVVFTETDFEADFRVLLDGKPMKRGGKKGETAFWADAEDGAHVLEIKRRFALESKFWRLSVLIFRVLQTFTGENEVLDDCFGKSFSFRAEIAVSGNTELRFKLAPPDSGEAFRVLSERIDFAENRWFDFPDYENRYRFYRRSGFFVFAFWGAVLVAVAVILILAFA